MNAEDRARVEGLCNGLTVCRRAGVTYRQLDYWIRTGLVSPTVRAQGSGTIRLFDDADIARVMAIRVLLDHGITLPAIRRLLAHGGAATALRNLARDLTRDIHRVADMLDQASEHTDGRTRGEVVAVG